MVIRIVGKDLLSVDASPDDMMQRTCCVYAGLPWHEIEVSKQAGDINLYIYVRPLLRPYCVPY